MIELAEMSREELLDALDAAQDDYDRAPYASSFVRVQAIKSQASARIDAIKKRLKELGNE
jgi:hypothetical protein